jgi:hypothetical protein
MFFSPSPRFLVIYMFYFQGMMWGLACIVLIYDDYRIPYLKGENYTGPTSAKLTYTTMDRYPSELAIMGIISFCLTLVNIACIFSTAIVVLKASHSISIKLRFHLLFRG